MLRPSESSTPEGGGPVRTYHGRTIEELLPRIQEELGADAIIVSRREGLTGGLAGFFQRPFVELDATAGGPRIDIYDEAVPVEVPEFAPEHPSLPERQAQPEQQALRTPFYTREPLRPSRDSRYVTEDLAALARAGTQQPQHPLRLEPTSRQVRDLRPSEPSDPFARMLELAESAGLTSAAAGLVRQTAGPAHQGSRELSSSAARAHERGPERRPLAARTRTQTNVHSGLLALGVSEQFAGELLDTAAVHIRPLAPRLGVSQTVRSALIQRIPLASPLPIQGGTIVLVGPGGAGKTSCCAALLGAYRQSSTLAARCATLLGGPGKGELQMLLSPQIRKPVAVDSARAVRALRGARSEGLLVIDTPPLSPGDRSAIRKLASLLGELKPERVAIVLPATLGAAATAQLLQALRPLGANALALTHMDETDQIGVAVEAACKSGLAPEYMLKRARSGGWTIGGIDPAGLAAKLVQ